MKRGLHKSIHGSPACGVHATGSTSSKPRSTRVQRTRYGARTRQATDNPRAAYTLQGSHQASHGQPACSVHATGSTPAKARSTRVQPARYGAHTSQVRSTHVSACYWVHASRIIHVERELRGLHQSIHGLLQEAKDTLAQ